MNRMQYPAPVIIRRNGRLANRMFQYMFALELANRAGAGGEILGDGLPEWGIELSPSPPRQVELARQCLVLRGHNFNIDAIASAMRQGAVSHVVLEGWAMRLEYYRTAERYRKLFHPDLPPSYQAADDEVLLHVRAGDIIDGHHPEYFPLPPSYYAKVIADTGLRPVFIGELADNRYVQILRQRFPQARFLPQAGALADFQSLRQARHVALSVSSFSWLATWLSTRAETIHFPICGLFMPQGTGPNLLPFDDCRYRFYITRFPDMKMRRALGADQLLDQDAPVATVDRSRMFDLARKVWPDSGYPGAASPSRES